MSYRGLETCIGAHARALVSLLESKGHGLNREYERDLNEYHYRATRLGLQARADSYDRVFAIFLRDHAALALAGVDASTHRSAIRAHLGAPEQSGEAIVDDILGAFGAWDRFRDAMIVAHFEYTQDARGIVALTLSDRSPDEAGEPE